MDNCKKIKLWYKAKIAMSWQTAQLARVRSGR